MTEKSNQSKWPIYITEAIALTLILGILCGVVLGFMRGWKYISNNLWPPFFDILNLSINQSVLAILLFLFLYLTLFLIFRRVLGGHTKRISFIVGAISCLPFFLIFGYKINQANKIYWSNLLKQESLIFNLKVGIAFLILWLLISIVLYFWTRSRILNKSTFNIRGVALFLGIFLVVNISMSLYQKSRPMDSTNVIILLVDALGADHLSSYGYERKTTPNIDSFVQDSVMFTQAISQSTFTKTSIASLFTSRYPYQHGVYKGGKWNTKEIVTSDILSDHEITLAEILLQNGFLTAAWIEQLQLASYLHFAQGFVEYNQQQGNIERINKKFLNWIDKTGKKHKFFAYIHYIDLHDPYRPQPPYDTMHGVYNQEVYSGVDMKNWGEYRKVIEEKGNKQDIEQLRAYYDGQLTYIDKQIGILLEKLKQSGLYDNSLIILTADHGDAFMEHGFIAHNTTPYEELIRVPLIIKFPDSFYAGKVVKRQVSLIDVMPTILDFLNVKIDDQLEGFSLMHYLPDDGNENQKTNFPKYAYSEVGDVGGYHIISIRTERHKYIRFQNGDEEFYDLVLDPVEKNNIIVSKRDEASELRKIALYAVSEREKLETGKVTLDKKTIEELKALGYLGN